MLRWYLPGMFVAVLCGSLFLTGRGQATSAVQVQSTNLSYLPLVMRYPPPTATPTPLPTPTPAPDTLYIPSARLVEKFMDQWFVVGEVGNGTSDVVFHVEVQVDFYGEGGQTLGSLRRLTLLQMLAPGQRVPFKVELLNHIAGDQVSGARIALRYSTTTEEEWASATVLSSRTRVLNGSVYVNGEIRNDHSTRFIQGQIVVTFYDAAGRVVWVADDRVRDYDFYAGKTTAYEVISFGEVAYATYSVQVQGFLRP